MERMSAQLAEELALLPISLKQCRAESIASQRYFYRLALSRLPPTENQEHYDDQRKLTP